MTRYRIGEERPGQWRVLHDTALIGPAHLTRLAALEAMIAGAELQQAIVAAAGEGQGFTIPWGIAEGVETCDRRRFDHLDWRPSPLPLMVQTVIPEFGGHAGGEFSGVITDHSKSDGVLSASGRFTSEPQGERAARVIDEGLRGISADVAAPVTEIEVREVDEDGWPIDWLEIYPQGTVLGYTVTPHPAFGEAYIQTEGEAAEPSDSDASALTACGCASDPPAEWFTDPGLSELTPLTITSEGRVFGHFATWGTCHTGNPQGPGVCTTPPRGQHDFSDFLHHPGIHTREGTDIPVGQLTFAGAHAPLALDLRGAQGHYDNTTKAWADVTVGEDEHGPWFAGALRVGLSDSDLRAVRTAGLSGDWRPRGNTLRLIGVHSVNAPGFPVARVASGGQVLALVAGTGVVGRRANPADQSLARRVARLERALVRSGAVDLAASELDALLR